MSDYYPQTIDYGPLFGWASTRHSPAAAPLARRTDPGTSHKAARSRSLSGQKLYVYQALAFGPAGQTELAIRICRMLCPVIQMNPHQVNKRLSDLEREGRAEPTGEEVRNDGGHMERVWRRIEEATDGK